MLQAETKSSVEHLDTHVHMCMLVSHTEQPEASSRFAVRPEVTQVYTQSCFNPWRTHSFFIGGAQWFTGATRGEVARYRLHSGRVDIPPVKDASVRIGVRPAVTQANPCRIRDNFCHWWRTVVCSCYPRTRATASRS